MSAPQRRTRPNGHSQEVGPTPSAMQCPFCGQRISSRAEYRRITERIEGEERARIAKVEQTLKHRFAREKAQAETQAKAAVDKAKRDAARAAEQQVKAVKASLEMAINERVAAQREESEKKLNTAVAAERTKAYGERMKLDAQLADLQRKLQGKTAHELGEPAEIDLFEALEAAFPDDRVARVARGQRGPDLIIEVFHHDSTIGCIIVDSKNHKRWSNRFIEKLKADQNAEGADFAILSSTTFPAGKQQLHVEDGVVIVHPQRVVALVQLLRRQLITNHALRLNAEQRNSAAGRLFAYFVSVEASDRFGRLQKAADSLIDLEAKEVEAQLGVHRRRGELIRDVQRFHEDMTTAIDTLVSCTGTDGVAA